MFGRMLFLICCSLTLSAASVPPVDDTIREDMEAYRFADVRVNAIGERLATANAAMCQRTVSRTGLVVHHIDEYDADLRPAANTVFGFGKGPFSVRGIVPGSAADTAGVRQDSVITAIDGTPVSDIAKDAAKRGTTGRFAAIDAFYARLDTALADGAVTVDVIENGKPRQIAITGKRGCATRFQLVDGGRQSQADGEQVQIGSGTYDFANSDDELAVIVAHELAHNILDHRKRLDAKGIARGFMGSFGRSARLVRHTEIEADRLAVYLMANAGYDATVAPVVWERSGKLRGPEFLYAPTHPRNAARVALVRNELGVMEQARLRTPAGQPVIPAFARPPFAPLE